MNSKISQYMICLPSERQYGKHLQQMSDECSGGGTIWPCAAFSFLVWHVLRSWCKTQSNVFS